MYLMLYVLWRILQAFLFRPKVSDRQTDVRGFILQSGVTYRMFGLIESDAEGAGLSDEPDLTEPNKWIHKWSHSVKHKPSNSSPV